MKRKISFYTILHLFLQLYGSFKAYRCARPRVMGKVFVSYSLTGY